MNVRLATEAMGTRFELVLSGEDEFFLRAAGEQAIEIIEDEHDRLSLFDPSSLVGRINAAPAGQAVPVDRALLDLLSLAEEVHEQSGGAFDPAVGAHMRTWGHRGEASTDGDAHGFESIRIDRASITVTRASDRVAIDLGGIAKGYALDLAADAIRDAGADAALLHGGTSSIVAIGAPTDTDGWRVRLSDDDDAPELVLRDCAASFSSPAGRVSDGGASHIIDPRTGDPVQHPTEAAAAGPSGTLADAWATAMVVLGHRPDRMPDEIGSAVRTGASWQVSPSMESVFRTRQRDKRLEHE